MRIAVFCSSSPTIDSKYVELANYNASEKLVSAVLYQQAFRFFRENYGYTGGIRKLSNSGNNSIVGEFYKDEDNHFMIFGNTYEDCELKALKNLIEILGEVRPLRRFIYQKV